MNFKIIAAIAAVSLLASPAVAKHKHYRHQMQRSDERGLSPVDAAVGITGAAVGTAGAIASAPFRSRNAPYGSLREDRLQREGSGESSSFGSNSGGTRSPGADGDLNQ